jgi:hypothetical protein
VRLVIGSFSVAALLGVIALLAPGRFGSVQGRVLLTTVIVGATSVLTLCYLAVGATPARWVGVAGEAAALVASSTLLIVVWAFWDRDPGRGALRTLGVSAILAVTLAQFSLLLSFTRRTGVIPKLLAGTLAAGTTLAACLIAAVLGWSPDTSAIRLIGVVAILDVLGTVVTIALAVFGRDERTVSVTLAPEVAAMVLAESAATGRPASQVVDEALAHYFDVPVE